MDYEQARALTLFRRLVSHLSLRDEKTVFLEIIRSSKDRRRRFRAKSVRTWIYLRDGGKCFYCEQTVEYKAMHVDHVLPHSKGGQTTPNNGVVSCRSCNLKKSNKVW